MQTNVCSHPITFGQYQELILPIVQIAAVEDDAAW